MDQLNTRLPPLNALRSFESAARLGSLTAAALELNVSQAAVSQQVKLLEQYLQTPLFVRSARTVHLTDAGKNYLPSLSQAFRLLRDSSDQLFFQRAHSVIQLRCTSSFASHWLMPRLPGFYCAFPQYRVQLMVAGWRQQQTAPDADIEIFSAEHLHAPEGARCLSRDVWQVAASPELLEARSCDAQDLRQHPLIAITGYNQGWYDWFAAQGQPTSELRPVLQTDTSALAIQAAQVGLGVCLVQSSLLAQPLADGSLTLLSDQVLSSHNGYYAMQLHPSKRPDLEAFSGWLEQQSECSSEGKPA